MEQYTGPIFGTEGEQYATYDTATPHKVPPYALGQELWLSDGRRYRFGLAGASALVAGKLYQSEVPDANFDTLAVPAPSSPTAANPYNNAGNRLLRVTLPANSIVANLWAGGYAVIEAAAGASEGRTYKILSHPASAGSEDVNFTLAAGNGLQVTLNTSDKVTFIPHAGARVIVHPAPPTAKLYGIAAAAIAANDYGWFQYKGPCACLIAGTAVIGGGAVATGTVTGTPDGSVEAAGVIITATAATVAQITELLGSYVGVFMEVAPTTDYGMVMLNIA